MLTRLKRLAVKGKTSKKFLVVGHPRSGTSYMSAILKAYGFDVGHEYMGRDGISSWQFAVDDYQICIDQSLHRKDYNFDHVLVCVRDPIKIVASTLCTEGGSFVFRRKHLKLRSNDLEGAVRSVVGWYQLILERPYDKIIHTGKADDMFRTLREFGYEFPQMRTLDKKVNSRAKIELSLDDIERGVPPELFKEFSELRVRLGYA